MGTRTVFRLSKINSNLGKGFPTTMDREGNRFKWMHTVVPFTILQKPHPLQGHKAPIPVLCILEVVKGNNNRLYNKVFTKGFRVQIHTREVALRISLTKDRIQI
jgi:hypothetical protein